VPDGGARILLCTAGSACVRGADSEMKLRRGGALWLPARDRGLSILAGNGYTQLFLAGDGL
jgi:mannose-6-phosphate isomerase